MAKLSSSEVSELIKIADAEIKEIIRKGRWYSLGIPVKTKIHYNLEEQIEAIEKLGNSENEKAFEYINRLLELDYHEELYIPFPWDAKYPNAKGELSKILSYNYLSELIIKEREIITKIESAKSRLENSLCP